MAYDEIASLMHYLRELQATRGEDAVQPKLNEWRDKLREMAGAGLNVAQPIFTIDQVQTKLNLEEIKKVETARLATNEPEAQPGPDAYKGRRPKKKDD